MKKIQYIVTATIGLMTLASAQAAVIGEYTFNNTGIGTVAERMPVALQPSSLAGGLSLSMLGTNTTTALDFAGFNNIPGTDNDGFGFGNAGSGQVMFLTRAVSGVPSAWGASVGTEASSATLNFTLTADAGHSIIVERIFISSQGAQVAQSLIAFQEAGAVAGANSPALGTGTVEAVLNAPVGIAPGMSKTFSMVFNSGAYNSALYLDNIAIDGIIATNQTFDVNSYRQESDPPDDWKTPVRRYT